MLAVSSLPAESFLLFFFCSLLYRSPHHPPVIYACLLPQIGRNMLLELFILNAPFPVVSIPIVILCGIHDRQRALFFNFKELNPAPSDLSYLRSNHRHCQASSVELSAI
jgi:hypothetical protein